MEKFMDICLGIMVGILTLTMVVACVMMILQGFGLV